jgi:flagellar motor switch protein FliG
MDPNNLPGSLKAAILLQSLGKEASQKVINNLRNAERVLIEGHLSQMGMVSPDLMEKVAAEFGEMMRARRSSRIRKVPMSGEDEDQSNAELVEEMQISNIDAIQSLEPDRITALIKDELPQTIAIILAHIKTEVASEVLSKLPENIQADVSIRISNLDKVSSVMVEEIDKVFGELLKDRRATRTQKAGGVGRLAEILNQIDGTSGHMILDEIEEINPELAAEIKQRMFVFEDLILVDDKGLQKLLRSVETKELAIALKAASEDVRDKIFQNMSERAGEMLREEIEVLGAVRMKEVEEAQLSITKIIQDMEAKGELIISGRKGDEFIA